MNYQTLIKSFLFSGKSKTTFLPGPNILIGSEDGQKIYLNSPQYMPTEIKVENKVSKREAVRLIFSQGKNIAFCFYILGKLNLLQNF